MIIMIIFRIDSALTRQIFYATSRLGIYNKLFMYVKKERNQGSKQYIRNFNIY